MQDSREYPTSLRDKSSHEELARLIHARLERTCRYTSYTHDLAYKIHYLWNYLYCRGTHLPLLTYPLFANNKILHRSSDQLWFKGKTCWCKGSNPKASFWTLIVTLYVKKVLLALCDAIMPKERSKVMDIQQKFAVKDQWSESYCQHQNSVEGGAIKWLKSASHAEIGDQPYDMEPSHQLN